MAVEVLENSLRSILTNLHVDVIVSKEQHICDDWERDNKVHSFNRLYYIVSGRGVLESDGVTYNLHPGQLILLPCHSAQKISIDSGQNFHKYWCHFTARVGNRDLFEMYRFPVSIDKLDCSEIEAWFQHMILSNDDPSPASILKARASLLSLLSQFLEQNFEEISDPLSATRKMHCVLQYIEQHLDQKITVEQLAGIAHYHPNYFIRAFHTTLGCSPIQYMKRLRIDKARKLLASDQPIGSIALAVGIEQHNFSTLFKTYTGFSPREFRRMLKHEGKSS
ncbi:AraC family transcriptional regulator [Paenibacillus oryzisoli]|uniref:HTH araC/xylS-type domain-containing protein n=1 Tax=Paenibacillus oryzisoli TaxID=1850517 RepID=A0A198AI45_9BACL|nr:AraC family transcriptional regulator [Paenibacillus oryzisoli]OAS21179.1 hypothetical protein A8708_30300 [Paenibacillus oryzisoli]